MSWIPLAIFTVLLLGWVSRTASGRIDCAARSRRLAGLRIVVVISGRHSCAHQRGSTGLHLDTQNGVPREILLARTATGPLARDDRAALEDLAAPHAPRLATLDAPARHSTRTGQSPHSDLASSSSAGESANHRSGSNVRHGSSDFAPRTAVR